MQHTAPITITAEVTESDPAGEGYTAVLVISPLTAHRDVPARVAVPGSWETLDAALTGAATHLASKLT